MHHLVVVGGVSQQASEGDGVGDAAQVDEEHGRDGLDVEALVEIAGNPGQLPLYVQVEAAAEAAEHTGGEKNPRLWTSSEGERLNDV